MGASDSQFCCGVWPILDIGNQSSNEHVHSHSSMPQTSLKHANSLHQRAVRQCGRVKWANDMSTRREPFGACICWIVAKTMLCLKGEGSSLDIAALTILDIGALQPRKWQLTGNDCSTAAQAVPALTDHWAHSCSQKAYYAPVNHARSSPHNPCT